MADQRFDSFTRMRRNFGRRVLDGLAQHGPTVAGRAVRVTAWSIAHFAFALAQQLAELLAPLLLILGIGWYALPRIVGLIQTSDGQMRDILNGLQDHVPTELTIEGHVLTPGGLILDGVLLMVIAAGLSTATAVLANELYRGR